MEQVANLAARIYLFWVISNRKTSNVNMGAKLSVGQILLWKSLNRLLCCQIYIIGKQILLWKIGPVPAREEWSLMLSRN